MSLLFLFNSFCSWFDPFKIYNLGNNIMGLPINKLMVIDLFSIFPSALMVLGVLTFQECLIFVVGSVCVTKGEKSI